MQCVRWLRAEIQRRCCTPQQQPRQEGAFKDPGTDGPEKNDVGQAQFLLANPLVLPLPQADGHFTIIIDTCATQLECILLQKPQDRMTGTIRYGSRTVAKAKKKLVTPQEECMADLWAILLLCLYLEENHLAVQTYHEKLRLLLTTREDTDRLARWALRPLQFEIHVVFRACQKNQAGNALKTVQDGWKRHHILEHRLPLIAIFGEGLAQYRIPGEHTNEEDHENQWAATKRA